MSQTPQASGGDSKPTITTEDRQEKAHLLDTEVALIHTQKGCHFKNSMWYCGWGPGIDFTISPCWSSLSEPPWHTGQAVGQGCFEEWGSGPESHSDFFTSIAMFIPSMLHFFHSVPNSAEFTT